MTTPAHTVVLLRHGESTWNKENRFTGWTDVGLSEKGLAEAHSAGKILKEKGFVFDQAFTSVLKRAIKTLWVALEELELTWIPVEKNWRLNERMYGDLQGLDKAETAAKHGEQQVLTWRRSYDIQPPAVTEDDAKYPGHDPRYKDLAKNEVCLRKSTPVPVKTKPTGRTDDKIGTHKQFLSNGGFPSIKQYPLKMQRECEIPKTECLKDTVDRFLPYWTNTIAPTIKSGKHVLIAAHDNISDKEIVSLDIPTGIPLVYELDAELKPIRHYYLADEAALKAAVEAVQKQGKAK